MATLWISEFRAPSGVVYKWPPLRVQSVAIGSSSVRAAEYLSAETRILRLHTDTACHFEIGLDPTASVTTSFHLPEGEVIDLELPGVEPGRRVAVIAAS